MLGDCSVKIGIENGGGDVWDKFAKTHFKGGDILLWIQSFVKTSMLL